MLLRRCPNVTTLKIHYPRISPVQAVFPRTWVAPHVMQALSQLKEAEITLTSHVVSAFVMKHLNPAILRLSLHVHGADTERLHTEDVRALLTRLTEVKGLSTRCEFLSDICYLTSTQLIYLELKLDELVEEGVGFGMPEVVAKLQSWTELRALRLCRRYDLEETEERSAFGDALKAMLLALPRLQTLMLEDDPFQW
jgi:hypothetical protein